MTSWPRTARRLALGALAVSLVACMHIPSQRAPATLRQRAPLSLSAPPSDAHWPVTEWWHDYHDPVLDALVERANATSPSLAQAQARFSAAEANVRTTAALSGARVEVNADVTRQRLSDNGLFPPQFLGFHWYNLEDLGLQVSYSFDWWGRERAQVNAALDAAHAAAADQAAARLLLTTSIAQAYFGWQADQARLALARSRIDDLAQQSDLARVRVSADITREDEFIQAQTTLSAAREEQATLETSAQLRRVTLAALLAESPDQLPAFEVRPLPMLDASLPDNLGIDLIARRPDIEASRWRVESAERGVAAARAAFYPDVSLKALLALQSRTIDKLLEYGSRDPQFVAAVHLPLFDAGELRSRYDASEAQLRAAIASYDDTVVSAARDVGSQALAREDFAQRRAQRAEQLRLAAQLRDSAEARSDAGITDLRPALLADRQWLDSQDSLLQLDAQALATDLDLIRSLGGGYHAVQTLAAIPGSP